jgi:UDP-galactose transporter B1
MVQDGGLILVLLGITGALGQVILELSFKHKSASLMHVPGSRQVFLFITIAKFGALNCALLGLLRKMLSLVLSFILYGHTLNAPQTVGLVLAVAAMSANFYGKVSVIINMIINVVIDMIIDV